MKSSFLFLLLTLLCLSSYAQGIQGLVFDDNEAPLPGAVVYVADSEVYATSDADGRFSLNLPQSENVLLVCQMVGYKRDTLLLSGQAEAVFRLSTTTDLDEVVISDEKPGVYISEMNPIKTETITQTELGKAACCDLAGCFETQTTVQPQTTNVITNSKELRILGLSGVYNQILIDGLPMVQGLSYTYGISGIPGTIVDQIHVSKGANSVVQGFESISGQINVETRSPANTDKLFVNAYWNSFNEKHFNANAAFGGKNWRNMVALHTVQPADRTDRHGDGFMDLPLLTRYMVYNRFEFGDADEKGWNGRVGLRLLQENRVGGQMEFNPQTGAGGQDIYGQRVEMLQPEFFGRLDYTAGQRSRFSLLASGFAHEQDSWFGLLGYRASQRNAYLNLQHEWDYSLSGRIIYGVSYRHLDLRETINLENDLAGRTFAGNYARFENIPGVFAENTSHFLNDKLTWIAGIRADFHNEFGTRVTPRTLLKYNIADRTSIRASAGLGWRTVNLFSENIGLLASSRDVIFQEHLLPEQALNYGLNFTHKFESGKFDGFMSADFYHTTFQNQVFPDYDSDPTLAIISNYTGPSYSRAYQAEWQVRYDRVVELKLGYGYLDVYRMIGGERFELPFNPRHKVLAVCSYKPRSEKFHFDVNFHWYGQQRLPDTGSNPEIHQRPEFSESYTMLNAQFTLNTGMFEWYIGCENIFDFRQMRPIVGWQDPFGPYFDTSSVWGPVRGREFYVGFRFRLT